LTNALRKLHPGIGGIAATRISRIPLHTDIMKWGMLHAYRNEKQRVLRAQSLMSL
jgi:hypothetical protein